nr:myb-like protein J [Penaeus vannamei]
MGPEIRMAGVSTFLAAAWAALWASSLAAPARLTPQLYAPLTPSKCPREPWACGSSWLAWTKTSVDPMTSRQSCLSQGEEDQLSRLLYEAQEEHLQETEEEGLTDPEEVQLVTKMAALLAKGAVRGRGNDHRLLHYYDDHDHDHTRQYYFAYDPYNDHNFEYDLPNDHPIEYDLPNDPYNDHPSSTTSPNPYNDPPFEYDLPTTPTTHPRVRPPQPPYNDTPSSTTSPTTPTTTTPSSTTSPTTPTTTTGSTTTTPVTP